MLLWDLPLVLMVDQILLVLFSMQPTEFHKELIPTQIIQVMVVVFSGSLQHAAYQPTKPATQETGFLGFGKEQANQSVPIRGISGCGDGWFHR